MKKELADYILCISESLEHTRQANDRPIYEKYLADAAVLLALAEKEASAKELRERIDNHERRWSQTWLAGDEYKEVASRWKKVKDSFSEYSA